MRFISAAIFLAAASSAVAVPLGDSHNTGYPHPEVPSIEIDVLEVETRDLQHLPITIPEQEDVPVSGRRGHEEGHVDDDDVSLPENNEVDPEVERRSEDAGAFPGTLPWPNPAPEPEGPSVPEHEHDEVSQHDLEPHVENVVKGVIITVVELKGLILKDLAIIFKLVDSVEVDIKALLAVLHSVEANLQQLLKLIITKIAVLVIKAGTLKEADLKVIYTLLVEIKAILEAILACLLHVVAALKIEILKLVLGELQAILALLALIVAPIIKLAMCAVIGLEETLAGLVQEILGLVADITKCSLGLTEVLTPVLKALGL